MERDFVVFLIFAAVIIGVGGQAWVSWLDHKRRVQALDVIKAAIEAGREPPAQLYEQIAPNPFSSIGLSRRPWAEAVLFAAVAIGFWIAFGASAGEDREKYLLVASIMSASSVGCFALAMFRPGQRRDDQ